METKQLLMNDYTEVKELYSDLKNLGTEPQVLVDIQKQKDNIRKELIEYEIAEKDSAIKWKSIKDEEKRDKVRNYITIGTFIISTGVTIWAVLKTFRFDTESTVTSTLGRGILGNIIPKFKK